jgi:hypothetical protein
VAPVGRGEGGKGEACQRMRRRGRRRVLTVNGGRRRCLGRNLSWAVWSFADGEWIGGKGKGEGDVALYCRGRTVRGREGRR